MLTARLCCIHKCQLCSTQKGWLAILGRGSRRLQPTHSLFASTIPLQGWFRLSLGSSDLSGSTFCGHLSAQGSPPLDSGMMLSGSWSALSLGRSWMAHQLGRGVKSKLRNLDVDNRSWVGIGVGIIGWKWHIRDPGQGHDR